MPKTIKIDYDPQPKQALLHKCRAKQILFGGAAGGGKSHAGRYDLIGFCLENPGLQAFIFRRSLPELDANHIQPLKRELPRELPREPGVHTGPPLRRPAVAGPPAPGMLSHEGRRLPPGAEPARGATCCCCCCCCCFCAAAADDDDNGWCVW